MRQQRGDKSHGLEGFRVLDLTGPQGVFCAKLLADLGADVVRVEPPQGDPMRRLPPFTQGGGEEESLFFWYFNTNKRSAALNLSDRAGREAFLRLVRATDVLLESFPPGHLASLGLDEGVLFHANPGLVLVSLTDFGQFGPFRSFRGSDLISWAMGGLLAISGFPDREPLTAPAMQAYQICGVWGLIGTLAALYRRSLTGQGARVDISAQEAVADMSESGHTFFLTKRVDQPRLGPEHPIVAGFRNYQFADGYGFIGMVTRQQWSDSLTWMSEKVSVASVSDPALLSLPERTKRRDDINRVIEQWASRLTIEELWRRSPQLGLANAPVRRPGEAFADEHLIAREFFVRVPDPRGSGRVHKYPGIPFRYGDGPLRRESAPAPRAGEHTEQVLREWSDVKPRGAGVPRFLPLEGLKVLDLSWFVAGPTLPRVLADLGAMVIKVEPREVGDPGRMLDPFYGGPGLNRSATFLDTHRHKLSVTIGLKQPRGKDLVLQLTRWADIVVENWTPGTLEKLGLGYDTLRHENPRVILASMSGYGQTGPRHNWPSYNPTSTALAGLLYLYAYPDNPFPLQFPNSYADYWAGFSGAVGTLCALLERLRTGSGAHVDATQLETSLALMGPELLRWEVNGEVAKPEGNQAGALGALLQGCYRCRGENNWIAVTVPDQATLHALAGVMGMQGTPGVDQVQAVLRAWAQEQEAWEAMLLLQGAGVPAGAVSKGKDLMERDHHLKARRMFTTVQHGELGAIQVIRCPIVLDGEPLTVRSAAPLLGEHTEYVLREMIGLNEEAYLECVTQEVV